MRWRWNAIATPAFGYEFRARRRWAKDGSPVCLDTPVTTTAGDSGSPIGFMDAAVGTESRHELDAERAHLAAMVASSDYGIVSRSLDGTILSWSPGAELLFGYAAQEMIGRRISTVPEDRVGEIAQFMDRLVQGHDIFEFETVRLHRDGRRIDVSITLSPIRDTDGRIIGATAIAREIGECKRTDAARAQSQVQLRALAKTLQTAREMERTRIARDLHDGLGQLLTALKLDLTSLRNLPPRRKTAHRASLDGILGLVDTTILAVRSLATELRPPELDALGLRDALEAEIARFAAHAGVRHTATFADPFPKVGEGRALDAFRIVQEALTNVARHARATAVQVSVLANDGSLCIEVADDGSGTWNVEDSDRRGLGLLGMQERALVWGGSVTVERGPPGGTRLRARIPLDMD